MNITLPISKSIANRLLILQAVKGDPLLEVSSDMPDDIILLHDALCAILQTSVPLTLDLQNCGTAMRFLTAFCASRHLPPVTLTGSERMCQRPVNQLVEALRQAGADIRYLAQPGFPPLLIHGHPLNHQPLQILDPVSSQFVSALLLVSLNVTTDSRSPYIDITRACVRDYSVLIDKPIETDWSSAAFWYEWLALHPQAGEINLLGLQLPSLQGDAQLAQIFTSLGIITQPTLTGIRLYAQPVRLPKLLNIDFSHIPDLYPAVAITCHRLHIQLQAFGTQTLHFKESDRLDAVWHIINGNFSAQHDHRISMALLAADLPSDDTNCISKSYPQFLAQLTAANRLL